MRDRANEANGEIHIPVCIIRTEDMDRVISASKSNASFRYRVKHVDPECPICQEEYTSDSVLLKLPCRHVFDEKCIEAWVNKQNTCPLCRFQLPTDDGERTSSFADDEAAAATWREWFLS